MASLKIIYDQPADPTNRFLNQKYDHCQNLMEITAKAFVIMKKHGNNRFCCKSSCNTAKMDLIGICMHIKQLTASQYHNIRSLIKL